MLSFLLAVVVFGLFLVGVWRQLGLTRDGKNADVKVNFRFAAGLPWFAGCLVFILLFVASIAFVSVDSGQEGVVKRFGKATRQLDPGAHFILPFAEEVSTIITQKRIVKPNENAATKDLQVVYTEVTLAYHIDPAWALYTLVQNNNDVEVRVINPAILEAIKRATAHYDAADLVVKRPEVRDEIEQFAKERMANEHIIAESTYITDFRFSKEYEDAIEKKQVAQQQAEQATNDLKRIKIEADQKVAAAEGEAAALKAQKEQITPELLELRTIEMMKEKWDGKLPETIVGGSSALPMMDVLAKRK